MSGRPAPRTVALTAAVAGLLIVSGWVAASGARWYRTADLFCIWSGAHLVASGADPYDGPTWLAATGGTYPDPFRGSGKAECAGSYAYPLWTAIATLPIGILPLEAAAVLWMTISIGGVVGGLGLLWKAVHGGVALAPVFAAAVISSQPFWVLVVGGQLTGILLALSGVAAWSLARERPGLAGVALASLLLKPQVAGVFAPAVLLRTTLRSGPRALRAAVLTAAALAVASFVARPNWLAEWVEAVAAPRFRLVELLPTAWGLSTDLLGDPRWAPLLIVALGLVVVALFRGRVYGTTTFAAVVLPLSLLSMPHVWSYDFLVLALSWAVAFALADRLSGVRRMIALILTLISVSLLPWSLYALAFARGQESLSAAVPASAALLVGVTVRLQRQGGDPAP